MSPSFKLQAVDGVEITTIMDNSLDLIMSSTPVARRFPLPQYGFTRPQLRAEHGVSMLITIIDQGKRETILFDTGVTPDGALHNLAVLGIDLSTIQAIVINVRNKGLVVATGCGHTGVINILRQVRSQTGVEQIFAWLGGFHLSGALFEPIISQ